MSHRVSRIASFNPQAYARVVAAAADQPKRPTPSSSNNRRKQRKQAHRAASVTSAVDSRSTHAPAPSQLAGDDIFQAKGAIKVVTTAPDAAIPKPAISPAPQTPSQSVGDDACFTDGTEEAVVTVHASDAEAAPDARSTSMATCWWQRMLLAGCARALDALLFVPVGVYVFANA